LLSEQQRIERFGREQIEPLQERVKTIEKRYEFIIFALLLLLGIGLAGLVWLLFWFWL
jgi:nitrate reductase NapE component